MRSLHDATNPEKRSLRAMVRRLAVVATARVLWQLSGVRNLDGTTEVLNVEVFPGIGFYARPPSGRGEVIMVNVGGANAPAVVASRDEQTRKDVADLDADEAAMFNSVATVHVTAAGTVDVRSAAGAAVPLATKADIDALREWALAHIHTDPVSGVTTAPTVAPPSAAGTTVLMGE